MPRLFCLALTPLSLWLLASCVSPPATAVQKRHDLVDVRRYLPTVVVDLRYTTAQNVTGRPLYPPDMPCLLRTSTAKRLKKAQARLRSQGYGLCIWDAWRPPEAHQRLHDHGRETGLFIDPASGWSRHCGGVSIDATLTDRQGRLMPMPTTHDENQPYTSSSEPHPDPRVRRHVEILHAAMHEAGLIPLPGEWWHFDDTDFLHRPTRVVRAQQLGLTLPGS